MLVKLTTTNYLAGMRGMLLELYSTIDYEYKRVSKRRKKEQDVEEDALRIAGVNLSLIGCCTPTVFQNLDNTAVGVAYSHGLPLSCRRESHRGCHNSNSRMMTSCPTLWSRGFMTSLAAALSEQSGLIQRSCRYWIRVLTPRSASPQIAGL
jgi:hypothetical protein